MYCPKCGNRLESDENFCGVCGCRIQTEEEEKLELEILEYQYRELLEQKEQKEILEQENEELRKEIAEILHSVENQTFHYKKQKVCFCPWCGAPAENVRFCSQCGRKIGGEM